MIIGAAILESAKKVTLKELQGSKTKNLVMGSPTKVHPSNKKYSCFVCKKEPVWLGKSSQQMIKGSYASACCAKCALKLAKKQKKEFKLNILEKDAQKLKRKLDNALAKEIFREADKENIYEGG